MPVNDEWWWRQLIEAIKEASKLLAGFKEASQPDVNHLDKAQEIYEECCHAYNLDEISFEEFTKYENGLPCTQAHSKIHKDNDNEY